MIRGFRVALLSMALVVGANDVSLGLDIDWITIGVGDWTTPGNWSAGVPGAGDTARVGRNGTAQINSAVPNVINLFVGHAYSANSGNGTVDLNAGANLTVTNEVDLSLHPGMDGTINHYAGANLTVGSTMNLGYVSGATSIYNLSGGTLHFAGGTKQLNVVNTGTFNYSSGSITGTPILRVGTGTGNDQAIFNLGGNTLSANYVDIDRSGGVKTVADQFNFQGGWLTTTGHFLIGGSNAVGGTVVSLSANERLDVGSILYVGYTDSTSFDQMATFNHNGGGSGHLNIGSSISISNGDGTNRDYFNQNSGTLHFAGGARSIDIVNEGTFNFVNGSITGTPHLRVGTGTGNHKAIFNLNGNSLTAGNVDIDRSGGVKTVTDEFNFQGGWLTTTGHFLIGGSNAVGGTVVSLSANERLDVGSILYVGYTDSTSFDQMATFNHNGGGSGHLNIGSSISISNGDGTNRDYFNQNSGTLHFAGGARSIDIVNEGTFNFVNGSITGTPHLRVGTGTGNHKAIFNLNGNSLTAGNVDIDRSGGVKTVADEFNFQGGTLTTTGHFLIGGSNAAGGTIVSVNSGEQLNVGTILYVGYIDSASFDQSGTLEVNGGQVNIANSLNISNGAGVATDYFKVNSGIVNFTGGTGSEISLLGQGVVGNYGGTISGSHHLSVGNGNPGLAIYEQTAGTTSISGQAIISYNGSTTGQFDLTGGTFTMTGAQDFYMWRTSTANVGGTGTLNLGRDLLIGWMANATADFNQSGGTVNVPGNVRIAANAVSGMTGSYDISGGTLNLTGGTSDLLLERDASMAISGGELNLARNMSVGTVSGFNASVNQTGGRVNVANTLSLATIAGATGAYTLSGGELRVGTLDLTNPGSDSFTLNGGKLSAIFVDNADGVFNFSSGMLSPGLMGTPSTMTFNTGLVMPSAGGLEFDLSTPEVFGSGINDLLVVNGDLTLDGILSVANVLPGDYPIITFTGDLNDLGLDVLFPKTQSIFVMFNEGGPGGVVWLTVLPIPEPSSLSLMSLGLLGLQLRRRSRKSRA